MKTIAEAKRAIIDRLNSELTEIQTMTEQDLVAILEKAINEAFASVNVLEQKKLYKALSITMHSDKLNDRSPIFMKIIHQQNLIDVPQAKLSEIWKTMEEKNALRSITYNPVDYVAEVERKLAEIWNQTMLEKENWGEVFELKLKEAFPELYKYEQYSSNIGIVMQCIATLVNIQIVMTMFPLLLVTRINSRLQRPLLNYATQGRYAKRDAEIKTMKATLTFIRVITVGLSDEEIEEVFHNKLQLTNTSQRSLLIDRGIKVEELTEDEIHLLFKKIWITLTRSALLEKATELQDNPVFQKVFEKITPVDPMNNDAIIEAFNGTSEQVINEIYSAFRKVQQDDIKAAIELNRASVSFTGLPHLNQIFSALQETWMSDVPIMERFLQALAIIVALPLISAGFLLDLVTTLIKHLCILCKAASVTLINAPLDVHAYFTQTSGATPTEANDNDAVYEIADVPSAGARYDGRLFSLKDRTPTTVTEESRPSKFCKID